MSTSGERASWPALVAIAFGGFLAIYAAVMFFAIEGWAFAALAISQVFIAFGVLAFARRLHKEPRAGHGRATEPSAARTHS